MTQSAAKRPAKSRTVKAAAAAAPAEAVNEFASITLTIDHLILDSDDTKTVLKVVLSTEDAHESLLAQLAYFGMEQMLRDPVHFRTVAAGLDDDVVNVLVVSDRQTNIIVDMDIFTGLVNRAGSMKAASEAIIITALEGLRAMRQAGNITPLFAFKPE